MLAVCSSFASTTKSYTLEEECRTLVIVQAFFEHKNSYQVQIYLTHETTDNSLRPPEESFHSFCLSANFPLKMKAWKQNMLCLFDFLAATRRIGDCLMNRSLKNQSLFQSEILWWGLDTMTWATWSKKFFWDQTNKVKMLFTLWRVIQVTTKMWKRQKRQWEVAWMFTRYGHISQVSQQGLPFMVTQWLAGKARQCSDGGSIKTKDTTDPELSVFTKATES